MLAYSILEKSPNPHIAGSKMFSWVPPSPVCGPFPGYMLSELKRFGTAGLGALSLNVKILVWLSCGCWLALLSCMAPACQTSPFLIIRLSHRFYCKHFLLLVLLNLCICAIISIDFIFYRI